MSNSLDREIAILISNTQQREKRDMIDKAKAVRTIRILMRASLLVSPLQAQSIFSKRKRTGLDTSRKTSTCDLSFEELQYLFNKLEVINHCEDVILQYQNEQQD